MRVSSFSSFSSYYVLVLSALVLLVMCGLTCVSGDGVWSEGTYYTDADVLRFAPILFFHPEDVYLPVNLAELVENSTICAKGKGPTGCTGPINLTTLGEEPYVSAPEDSYYLYQKKAFSFGPDPSNPFPPNTLVDCRNDWDTQDSFDDQIVRRRGGTVSTDSLQLLYTAQNISDSLQGSIALNFFIIQAVAGPETLGVAVTSEGIVTANYLADHATDLQWITVVIDPKFTTVRAVGGTGHGCTRYHPTALLGTRPILYSALNTHSLFGSSSLTGAGDLDKDTYAGNQFFTFFPWTSQPWVDYRNTLFDPFQDTCPNSDASDQQPPYNETLLGGSVLCYDTVNEQFVDPDTYCPYTCQDADDYATCTQNGGQPQYRLGPGIAVADLIGSGGPVWTPSLAALQQTGLDAKGNPIVPGQTWAKFTNRWGYVWDMSTSLENNTFTFIYCRYNDSDDEYCPASAYRYVISETIQGLVDAGVIPLTTSGASSIGARTVGNSPSVTRVQLDLAKNESSMTYPLAVEYVNGQDSTQGDASMILIGGGRGQPVRFVQYQPSAVFYSSQMWSLYDQVTTLSLTPSTDVEIIEFANMFVMLYANSSAALRYATSSGYGYPSFSDQGSVAPNTYSLRERARATVVGSTLYVFWPDNSHNVWFVTGSASADGSPTITWSKVLPAATNGSDGQIHIKWALGIAYFQSYLVMAWQADDSSTNTCWATQPIGAQYWTIQGCLGPDYKTDGSPALAVNPVDGLLYLAWGGTGGDMYNLHYATLKSPTGTWSPSGYINGAYLQGHNLDVVLHSTPGPAGHLYCVWLGNNGWEFSYFNGVWMPPVSPSGCETGPESTGSDCYTVPNLVKSTAALPAPTLWPGGSTCEQGFQGPAPHWALYA